MAGNADDTVILRTTPPSRGSGRGRIVAVVVAVVLLAAAGAGALWLLKPSAAPQGAAPPVAALVAPPPTAPPATPPVVSPPVSGFVAPADPPPPVARPVPPDPIPVASEAAILAESPAVRMLFRFAANRAVLVLDFPTLAEQGRMLNRVAAWAEKAGVPHDRLLSDPELAAAIAASGTTPDTYYYGHDYRGSDIARFFALADQEGIVLRPEEQQLRQIMQRAGAEPGGFGALITVVRADPANDTTPRSRQTILHHELSHGEYFTNPAYAAYVATIWHSVLTPNERAAFRTYLVGEGYDPALEDLMMNEMQAYLMHTPDPEFFDPTKLGIPAARLQQIRTSFLSGMPPGWLRDETTVAPLARPARP